MPMDTALTTRGAFYGTCPYSQEAECAHSLTDNSPGAQHECRYTRGMNPVGNRHRLDQTCEID